jgi:ABC-type bacteriocin/lantibiotic exporter with double-glycine peptidase domain
MDKTPNLSETASLFLQLFRLVKPYHKYIVKGMIIGPIIGLLSIAPPYFTKLLFDRVAENYDVSLMMLLVAGIVAFSITSAISEAVLHYYSSYLNIKLENTTQLLFFNHIQHLPFSFFYKRQVGEISSRFQEIKSALGSVHAFLDVVIGQGIYLLLVPPFLFFLNWKLALVALIAVPFSTLAIYWMSKKLRASWQSVIESHAEVEASQLEMLNQIVTVKVLQLERPLYQKTSSQLTNVLGAHMRAQSLTVFLMIFDKCINILNIGLFTWLGWHFILKGEMSLGDYVAFAAYVGYLRNPIMEMINLFTNFQQWAIHLKRIFDYLNLTPEQDPNTAISPTSLPSQPLLSRKLRLNNVSYQYQAEKIALKNITLEINKGEVIALIGGSGSGKSTLLRLLTCIEQGHSGEILFDERNIEDIPLFDLRAQLGVVWQDVELFQGTLRENLTIGMASVEQQWLEEIVELCKLTELITSLPQGYDTFVAERGVTLSGGQRQRVALARALIRKTPLLVLDEAMSNLDVETEAAIITNLFAHARRHHQTILFVTHRLLTAAQTDRIYLFDSGRILDCGTHEELIINSPQYQKLHKLSENSGVYE